MAINFPTSIDTLTNPTASDPVTAPSHAGQHSDVNDAVEALEAKVGADSSAVNTSHDFKLGGVATGDKAVSLTGTETLTNKTLTAPVLKTNVTVGETGVTTGSILMKGLTSGTVTVKTADAAGTYTLTLPTDDGTASQFLQTNGSGVLTWAAPAGGGDALVANPLSQFAATTSLQLLGVMSDETGTGALVFATSPTLVTPVLGTPASGTLTNCTGLPLAGVVDSTTEALGVGSLEVGHASDTTITRTGAGAIAVEGVAVLLSGGALGTPSSGTLTNATGLPVAGIAASTVTALGVGSIELGHASDTTIARVSAGVASIEGVNILTTAGGTLTGNITLGENTSIALDPAGSADGKYTGITVTGTAGEALAFGDVIVLDVTAGKWFKGSVSAAAAADGDLRGGTGMCVLAAAGDASATTVLLMGTCRADANFPALTIGSVVYATTAGDITVTRPSTTDHIIKVLGYALTADEIMFCPSMDYITNT